MRHWKHLLKNVFAVNPPHMSQTFKKSMNNDESGALPGSFLTCHSVTSQVSFDVCSFHPQLFQFQQGLLWQLGFCVLQLAAKTFHLRSTQETQSLLALSHIPTRIPSTNRLPSPVTSLALCCSARCMSSSQPCIASASKSKRRAPGSTKTFHRHRL